MDKLSNYLSTWMGKFIFIGVRVDLLNSIFNSIPIYLFSFYKSPKCVTQEIVRTQRDFMRGRNS